MDVVDENQSSHGMMASSPAQASRKPGSTPKSKSKVARASPLAERARDAQGMVMGSPNQAQADGTRNGASKRGRLDRRETDSSRRKTASNLDVLRVMDALASPSTVEVALEGGGSGEGESGAASSKKAKRRHHRRLTADLALKEVLDDSMASQEESPTHAAAAAADKGDATADFSAIFDLVDKQSPAPTSSQISAATAAAAAAASPPPAAADTPRAKRLNNQKPGRDSLAQGLVEPVSSLPGESVAVSNGEREEEEERAVPATNPAAPTQRARRPKRSISRSTPPDNREDLAAPTTEPRPEDGIHPSRQPDFASPAAAGASGSAGSIGGGGDGETGEVGELFGDMSGDDGGGGGGGGGAYEQNSQHTATDIDAIMAELGRGGDEAASAAAAEDRSYRHTAIDMDTVVAELGRESSSGGGRDRPARRETADKDGLESLFGSSVGSPAPSSALDLDHTGSPGSAAAASAGAAAAGDDEAGGRGGFEDATAEVEVEGSWSAMIDTPEPALRKKDKRRETADASNLQGLLFDSPDGGVVPSPSPAADTAARAAEAEDSASPEIDLQRQQQGCASTEPEPSPLGAAAAAAAAATPGSERSSATAVSMKGVLELASPPGAASDVRAAAEEEGAGVVATTPRRDGRFGGSQDDDDGDGGKDSGRTAGSGSVLGLLDSTPSPGGGLDQSVADGSALRGRTLARVYDSSSGGGSSVASARDTRRDTCEPGMFEGIVGDLESSPGSTPASSAGTADCCVGEDDDAVSLSPHVNAARQEAASPPRPKPSSPTPSPEAARQTTTTQPGSPAADAHLPGERMDEGTDTGDDDDSFDSPGSGRDFEGGARAKRKDDRRATASPTLVGALMGDLGLDSDGDGEEKTDDHRTIDSMETLKASSPEDSGRAPSPQGAAEVPPTVARTPSPPVARRTRSKSPASVQKTGTTTAAEVGVGSPRMGAKKRASSSMSASPAAKASASKTAPESARGRLKSCLSSRKRSRGGPAASATTPGDRDRTSPGSHDSPDLTASADSVASGPLSPSAGPPAAAAGSGTVKTPGTAAGGGRTAVPDIGLETPRRVMFGAPMAAEFNHTSPSNRLTPMPSRDARSLFPLEKQQEAETDEDEDEDTAANSAQLAEWEGVEPRDSWGGVEAGDSSEDGESFGGFDGVNGGGSLFSPERDAAVVSKASPSPRNRRRESLAIKSPIRKSIKAYSQDVRTMEDAPSPYDSDVDAGSRMLANLNASISGPATAEVSAAAVAAAAAAAAAASASEEPQNRSFSIITSQLHPLNDSDSSLELTGTFSAADELKTPAIASAMGVRGGGSGAPAPVLGPAVTNTSGGRGGADDGEGAEVDESRIELNDSSELEANLHGMSFRTAASPAPDSRRVSSGSLMSVVSEVEEIEAEVLSQASREKADGEEGEGEGSDKEEEALSPPPTASEGHGRESTGDAEGPESTSAMGQTWGPSLAFGQGENARLATVVEEMSPNSLLSSDQSQAQSRRWESLGGASMESTFELQADIMDSVHELMGPAAPATATATATAPAASSGAAPSACSPSSSARPAAVEPRKRRESVGGRREFTGAARGAGQQQQQQQQQRQRRQSVGGPPPSPTVELSGALGSYMGDPAADSAAAEAAMPEEAADGATAVQAPSKGGNERGGGRRRRESSVGGAPPSPTVELEADLMGYLDDPVAQPLDGVAAGGGGGGRNVRWQSLGSPSAAGGDRDDKAEEEGDGNNTGVNDGNADQAAHSSPSQQRSPPQAAVAPGGAGAASAAAAAAAAAVRPPLHRPRRASVSAAASQEGGVTQDGEVNRRRASLQVIMQASRRKSLAAANPSAVGIGIGGGGGGSKMPLDKAKRRETAAGNLRRRLSSAGAGSGSSSGSGSGSGGQSVADAAAVARPQEEARDADQPAPSEGDGKSLAGAGPAGVAAAAEEGCDGVMDESMEDMTAEDLTETVSPLLMDVNDLVKFVAPEMATGESQAGFSSMVVPPGGVFPQERLRGIPDEILYAMASAMNDAAAEMEGGAQWRQENAVRSAEVAWDMHSHAPVLGQIDRAIAEGAESSPTFVELSSRVRGLATQIKAGLERQWGAWEVSVLERMADEAGKVLSKISQRREALVKKGDDLDNMFSHAELAENAIMLKTFRDNVRSRLAKNAEKVEEAQSDIAALEAEAAALELQQQEVAAKKAPLVEGRARREERSKAVARRSSCVVRLSQLESTGIRLEKEVLEMKEQLDVQLGLRLWCQPITLLPTQVEVAYAAPHDRTLKRQLKFALDGSSAASATSAVVRGAQTRSADMGKGWLFPKGGIPDVGGMNSASGRLSRLIFEGESGLFSGGGVGAVAAGLGGVKSDADMMTQLQNAEWFVGRAYSLLQEVRDLEKQYACTTKELEDDAGAKGLAVLCIEVANWRSRQKLVRLRFRLSTSFACCVGAPEVEIDIGDLDPRVVHEAIGRAGGDQAGVMSVTKGVQAAAACM